MGEHSGSGGEAPVGRGRIHRQLRDLGESAVSSGERREGAYIYTFIPLQSSPSQGLENILLRPRNRSFLFFIHQRFSSPVRSSHDAIAGENDRCKPDPYPQFAE